jgi:DNA-binding NtrC family response regulator
VLVVCEVHALSLTAQTMLLDLERARIEDRAGGIRRIIATTSASLPDAVRNGAFDSRLFHRLNMIRVEIPTLP